MVALFFGSLSLVLGFLIGYYRRSLVTAILLGAVLSFITLVLNFVFNPLNFFLAYVMGSFSTTGLLLGVALGAAFAFFGWYLGKEAGLKG